MSILKRTIPILLFCLALSCPVSAAKRYTDVYNSFSLVPPDGWWVKVYKSPSSKVKFYEASAEKKGGASLLVLANPAGERKSLKEDAARRVRQLQKLGGNIVTNVMITFARVPCSHISADIPSRRLSLESYMFSKYGRSYAILTTVPLGRRGYYAATIKKILEGFKCIPPDDYVPESDVPAFAVTEKCRLLDEEEYPGAVGGKLNFIELTIANRGSKEIEIGGSFRVLMNEDRDSWHQFALAAVSTNGLHVSRAAFLRYGMGASTMALKKAGQQRMLLFYHNMSRVVNDATAEKKKIDLNQWWPRRVAAGQTVVIKWPTFWFSDLKDRPLAIVGPRLMCATKQWYSWLDLGSGKLRLIPADSDALLKILRDEKEPTGLRSAAIAWVVHIDRANIKYLMPYIRRGEHPRALTFRAMQAIAVWGTGADLDIAYHLWKDHKMAECLDNDFYRYLSWSALDHASELITAVKLGGRDR